MGLRLIAKQTIASAVSQEVSDGVFFWGRHSSTNLTAAVERYGEAELTSYQAGIKTLARRSISRNPKLPNQVRDVIGLV